MHFQRSLVCVLLFFAVMVFNSASATVFTVTNTNDIGNGSLRWAIEQGNANSGIDFVEFNIPGPGPHTISPNSELPIIVDPLIIDGYTQPGAVSNTNPVGQGLNGILKIELDGSNAGIDAIGLWIEAESCGVRGLAINRFDSNGIYISSNSAVIAGNYIGTDITGQTGLGNSVGITILTGRYNFLGEGIPVARNLISGNTLDGVTLGGGGFTPTSNVIRGNLIGTDVTGQSALGNGRHGVFLAAIADSTFIGGTTDQANVIAYNGEDGICGALGSENAFLANAIHSNGDMGIDLGQDGVTPNDLGDGDTGPNNLQNFPVLTVATSTAVQGTLYSTPDTWYWLEFFANTHCDPSGYGEGQTFLGDTTLWTYPDGSVGFTFTSPIWAQVGQFITATATEMGTNTSEFSNCVQVVDVPTFTVNSTDDVDDGTCDATHCSFREAINVSNTNPGKDFIKFDIPGHGPHTIRPNSELPAITDSVIIDGYTQPGAQPNTNPVGQGLNTLLKIELDGNTVGRNGNGLLLVENRNTIRGLAIHSFGSCIRVTSENNTIEGNFLGTIIAGTATTDSTVTGVRIAQGANNTIGGTVPSARNLINGIVTGGAGYTVSGTVIQGNLIGTERTGTGALGEGFGVRLSGQSMNSIIGGGGSAANVIAFCEYAGVTVVTGSYNNAVLSNSIFSNWGLGIDLQPDSVTVNDPADGDTGPNNHQNFPVLTSANSTGMSITVTGSLNSAAHTDFYLEFFANEVCDVSGYGEGKTLLGSKAVTTDGSGNAMFSAIFSASLSAGYSITATATDPNNNTSEFSQCCPVTVCCACADCNADGVVNILDALWEVNCILGNTLPPCTCDCNQDGNDNVLDVICIVNLVLGGVCP